MSDRLAALRRPRVLAVLAVVLVVLVVLFVRDALAARSALTTARSQVVAARTALGQGDVEQASAVLQEARAHVGGAQTRVDGPLWAVAKRVPLVGRTPEVLVRVVDVADAALEVAGDAVAQGEQFLGDDGSIEVSITDGRIDLTPMRLANSMLSSLPIDRLEAAREQLISTPDTWMPEFVRAGRREAVVLADLALDTLTDARDATSALPSFLGSSEPRRYFLALQNPGELRGTGGLFGFVATIEFHDGLIVLGEPASYDIDPLTGVSGFTGDDIVRRDSVDSKEPIEAPDDYVARYQHVAAHSFLANANVDPDLPTTGPVLTRLIEDRTGLELDGLIAMDPYGFERILAELGPIRLPDVGLDLSGIPNPVPPDRFAELSLIEAYDRYGGPTPERQLFHQTLAGAAFEAFLAGGWDGVAMSRAMGEVAAERHIQLYSKDESEQAAFQRLGIGGTLRPGWEGADLLAVTANNAAGSKSDVHVAHRITADIELGAVRGTTAARDVSTRIGLDNPLGTTGHDEYILLNLVPRPGRLGIRSDPGVNRTWFTLWTPGTTGFTSGRDAEGRDLSLGAGILHGHHAADHFLETQPESSNHFEVDLSGPVELVRDGPDLVYRLTVWRQSKAIPDHLDVSITGPGGWGVAEVTLEGGGDGQGMGVGGDGQPVSVTETTGGTVRIRGAATQDLHIQIRYSRSLLGRLWAWINAPL